jgi:hypothetical protein
MKKFYQLLILILLMIISTVLTASSQELVSQTVYVFDGDFNGSLLSDVSVTGEDAAGSSFEGLTDENGSVVLFGEPGTWQFAFMKNGYDTLNLNYDVTQTDEGAVYLQRITQPQDQVALTIYVYDEGIEGTLLSDVHVIGKDAAGNSFESITDSNGAAVLYGQPGTWKLTFLKDGFDPQNLDQDIIQSGEGAVYLQRATRSQDQTETSHEYQQSSYLPLFQPIPQQTGENDT